LQTSPPERAIGRIYVSAAHFMGFDPLHNYDLGLTPQALRLHLLRRLRTSMDDFDVTAIDQVDAYLAEKTSCAKPFKVLTNQFA
jgi:hypothetical protein